VKVDRYRPLFAVLLIFILALTNLAHLLAYSSGRVAEYSAKWDSPQINLLNLALLGLLVALALMKTGTEEET
jgi:hypothetical protein